MKLRHTMNDENDMESSRTARLMWKEKRTSYRYTLKPEHNKNWRVR